MEIDEGFEQQARRAEDWTDCAEQASIVATNLLSGRVESDTVPPLGLHFSVDAQEHNR